MRKTQNAFFLNIVIHFGVNGEIMCFNPKFYSNEIICHHYVLNDVRLGNQIFFLPQMKYEESIGFISEKKFFLSQIFTYLFILKI
jgi:hypothetical protein